MIQSKALVLAGLLAFTPAFIPPAHAQTRVTAACPSRAVLDAIPNKIRSGDATALAEFHKAPGCHHWITFYYAAEALFKAGQRDEGVQWFYVAQIRGRTTAALGPRSSAPSTIQALQYVIGQPLNEYAGGDRDRMLQAIDWAIDWDSQNPMPMSTVLSLGTSSAFGSTELNFDPSKKLSFQKLSPRPTQTTFDAAYARQRAGIAGLRKSIADVTPEEWIAERRKNGLN